MSARSNDGVKAVVTAMLLLVVSGCNGTGQRSRPGSQLEHSLFFTERDQNGRTHPISTTKLTADVQQPVDRVADGATIDVNSTLVITLRGDALGRGAPTAGAADLGAVGRSLAKALDSIHDYYDVLARADLAWAKREAVDAENREGSPEDVAYKLLKQQRAKLEIGMLDPIRILWPRDDAARLAQRLEAEQLLAQIDDPVQRKAAVEDFVALTTQRIEEWHRDASTLASLTSGESGRRKLRIEAYVRPGDGKGDPSAVHVPGYDTLDQGSVSVIDRFGVFLTEPERAQLVGLSASSHEIAIALERLRRGEKKWQETLLDMSKILPVVDSLVAVAKQLDGAALQAREQATQAAWRKFVADVAAAGSSLAATEQQALQQQLGGALSSNVELSTLVTLIQRIDALCKRWRHPTTADLPQLATDSLALAREVKAFVDDFEGADLIQALVVAIHQKIETLGAGSPELKQKMLAAWQPFAKELDSWRILGTDVMRGARVIAGLLGLKHLPPKLEVTNVASIDVPVETASDTGIDLRTTPRRPHDLLQLRARLIDSATGADAVVPFTATLGIEKLGWHAELVPSVAYVTADKLPGSDRGGFSPALSWMWSYDPRDDESDPYLSRSLAWGAGLHACFLNYDPDRDVQIGLGATFSLWDDRLMAGAGYNLFAEEEDDGRFYFFFGSSLIPLLQSLNGRQ